MLVGQFGPVDPEDESPRFPALKDWTSPVAGRAAASVHLWVNVDPAAPFGKAHPENGLRVDPVLLPVGDQDGTDLVAGRASSRVG